MALVSEGGRLVVVPNTPLLAGRWSPAPWSATASILLGWTEAEAAPTEVLPNVGRVSVSSLSAAAPVRTSPLVAGLVQQIGTWGRRALVAVLVACLLPGVLLAKVGIDVFPGLIPLVAIVGFALFNRIVTRRQAGRLGVLVPATRPWEQAILGTVVSWGTVPKQHHRWMGSLPHTIVANGPGGR